MIESITIKNIATYDNTGIQITDLKKVNFIYGANGSGKTTITKFIDEQETGDQFSDCSLVWKNGLTIRALVYNKDFRDRNFGKGNIDGVFTLGQATKEEIEAIEQMQKDLAEIKAKGIEKKETLEKQQKEKVVLEAEFKEAAWIEVYKKHETTFKDAFRGVIQKKETFKAKILTEFANNTYPLKTLDELKEKAKTVFGKTPEEMQLISKIDFARILEIESDGIWEKKIIGKKDVEIANLIQRLNLNDWVHEGKWFLQEDDSTCPFCQQPTITEEFRKQLEDYFDESFVNDTQKVKSYSDEYGRIAENLFNILTGIETAENGLEGSKLDKEKFSAYFKTLSSQFISNRELLNKKIKEPSRSIDLISVQEQLVNIRGLIQNANTGISKHNEIVANYSTEKRELISSIWKYLVEEYKIQIDTYNKKVNGLQKGIDNLRQQHSTLQEAYKAKNNEISQANKNVTSVQPSVDEINKTLKSFGFLNFEIVPSLIEENQYQIQREDGSIAESTLSEGEITFITFLYFLQLAKGSTKEENVTEERILVVDDPISSLDSNILFVVSSLLKEIIKSIKKEEGNIKQLILLTHNVYFHKEVSFIDGRIQQNKNTCFWILRKKDKISTIQSFEMENPIQSSYELLWKELKNWGNSSGITVQNIMRRIIENYFKILGKYGDDQLIAKFSNQEEQEICRSLICWINDGSHGITDDLYVERQDTTIDKYLIVFKKIFDETGHIEHYNMMMGDPLV